MSVVQKKSKGWIGKAQERLQLFANRHFSQWLQSKQGAKWKSNGMKGSPYNHGYSLPDHVHDLIEAVGRGDEERAKYLMLLYYV